MASKGDPRVSTRGKALARQVLAENPQCVYCGGKATEADHIIPLALGGSHDLDNLQATCGPCNRSKGTKRAPKTVANLTAKVLSEGVSNARGEVVDGSLGKAQATQVVHHQTNPLIPAPMETAPSVVVTRGVWAQ